MGLYNGTRLNYPTLITGCTIITVGLKMYYNGSIFPFFNDTVTLFGQSINGVGITGTISNPVIDDVVYNGQIRYSWEIVTSCGGKSTHQKEVRIPYCEADGTANITEYNRPNNEPIVGGTELGVADYFTTEHRTGAKWINGKDIYRIVLTCFGKLERVLPSYFGSIGNYDEVINSQIIGQHGSNSQAGTILSVTPYVGQTHLNTINQPTLLIYNGNTGSWSFLSAMQTPYDCSGNTLLNGFSLAKGDVFMSLDSSKISSSQLDRLEETIRIIIEYTK